MKPIQFGPYIGLFLIFLGIKNLVPFFHIMWEWRANPPIVSDILAYYSIGSFAVDFIFLGIGIILLIYRDKKAQLD